MFPEYIKRAVLVFASIIISILIIEGFLRFGGGVFNYLQERENKKPIRLIDRKLNLTERNEIVILCIGESTTAWGGGSSWPSQLQLILNSTQEKKIFHIINKGLVGKTTRDLLRHLKDNLDKYKPDIILAMVGLNDFRLGINDYKLMDGETKIPEKNRLNQSGLMTFLNQLRIYKVFEWNAEGTQSSRKRVGNHIKSFDNSEVKPIRDKASLFWDSGYDLINPKATHLQRQTISNLNDMVGLATDHGVDFVFVGYALRKIDIVKNIIEREVLYISNYEIFRDLLNRYKYDELFTDNYAKDFGHATPLGNRIIAGNVAQQLLKIIGPLDGKLVRGPNHKD